MARGLAMRGSDLDWERELCEKGCREWILWYRNKKSKQVYGCRIGLIPQKSCGQWYCPRRNPRKKKESHGEESGNQGTVRGSPARASG